MAANTLHIKKLPLLLEWLDNNEIMHREGKGAFQVRQIYQEHCGWQTIFSRLEAKEHYSYNRALEDLIRKFLYETKTTAHREAKQD